MKQNNEPKLCYTMSRNAQTIMAHTDGEGYPVVQGELAGFVASVAAAGGALVVSNYHNAYETALETQLDTYLGFSKNQGLKPANSAHDSVFTTIGTKLGLVTPPADVADALLNEAMAISSETSSARSAEAAISTGLSSEVSTARSAEAEISTGLSSEVSTARSAEAAISTGLSTEVSTARSAEAAISTGLSTEVNVRSTADVAISDALSTEVNVRSTAEVAISDALSTEVSTARSAEAAISTGLSTEVNVRSTADVAISDALSTEVSTARSAEDAISTALSTEVTTARSAETVISTGLSSEVTTARSAEEDLSTQIANIRGSSLDKVYDVVSQYVTASAVEAYRTRLWLSEIDRFLNVMKANISVEPSAQTYNGGSVLSTAVIANRLNSVSGTVLSGVALDFGLNDALLSSIVAGDYTVSTGAQSGVGEINTTKDTVGNYQQLFSQSG